MIRNQKKEDQIEIIIIFIKKTKQNHKLNLKDKIKNNKNQDKMTKKKKLKAERPNQNILHIQIRNQWLN